MSKEKKKIVIFASGEGSNAENIMNHFEDHNQIQVSLLISNNPDSGALDKAVKKNIPIIILDRKEFFSNDAIIKFMTNEKIDLITLAGFLWLIPEKLVKAFSDKIINIHPALLPKHGGKGMFGMNVHKAVLEVKEKESGITIHYVNENFDEGKIIAQKKCPVSPEDTPESLAIKVRRLEHEWYPKIIEQVLFK